MPIGISYAGIAYAVMMATPANLNDFAVGFSLTEGIVRHVGDIRGISIARSDDDIALDITLVPEGLRAFLAKHRTRSLRGHSSCGICGTRDLAVIYPAPARVPHGEAPDSSAVGRASRLLRDHQPLARLTHAAHAAAWASSGGLIDVAREDIGRHNALDKLIGALAQGAVDLRSGFCIVTSRCSYEMVQKAIAAGFPALASLGASTALAERTASAAGLHLATRVACR